MLLLCCHYFSYTDFIGTVMALLTGFILWVAWSQLAAFNTTKKVEFTYKIDEDFFNFLNDQENILAKNWLIHDETINLSDKEQEDKLTDLLNEFEGIFALLNRNQLDEDVFYDSLSYYVELLFAHTKTPTLDSYIESCNKVAKENGFRTDIYEGLPNLLERVKKIQQKRQGK